MIRLFSPMPRGQFFFLAAFGIACFFATWWVVAVVGSLPPAIFPPPALIVKQLHAGPPVSQWCIDIGVSLLRIFAGFVIAAVIAVPTGILAGAFRRFDALTWPFIEAGRYVPVPALLPLCILWLGIGEAQKVAVVFLGTFFQLAAATADTTRSAPSVLIDAARTLGQSEWRVLRRVVVPYIAPTVFDLLRISLGWAWSYLVVAELVAAGKGIGYRILWAERYLQVGLVFVGIAALGCIAVVTDLLFRRIRVAVFRWL